MACRGSPAPGGQCLHRRPPPPELAFPPGEKNRQAKKKTTFARLKFAPSFQIRPYKLGRRPLQGLRPGAIAPPLPPLGTPLGGVILERDWGPPPEKRKSRVPKQRFPGIWDQNPRSKVRAGKTKSEKRSVCRNKGGGPPPPP